MSLESQIVNRRIKRIGPLGKVAGLLTASLVVLIGLVNGLTPEVILLRALVASLLVGTLVAFGISVVQVANQRRN
jgi:hypothetical protein